MITSNYQVDGDIYSYADKFFCDSSDDKPSNADAKDGLINGAILEVTDTGKTYIFDKKANKWAEKSAGGGGGGGGSTTLAGLTDVDISNPSNGQTLVYNATSGKWENGTSGPLFVNASWEESLLVCDKTANDMLTAFQGGRPVFITLTDEDYMALVIYADNSYLFIAYNGTEQKSFIASTGSDYPAVDDDA